MKKNKVTLNQKFKPLIGGDTRYYIITGGRGSSKSFSTNVFLCLLTFQQEEKILFTRKTLTSAYISIIPEFKEKLKLLDVNEAFDIKRALISNKTTGSEIIFKGIQSGRKDNVAKLKSLQGITCWVLDEAEELTDEKKFNDIDLSIRKKGKQNRVILIMNPASKTHWVYKRFFEDAGVNPAFNGVKGDVTYIHTSYKDNIDHLSESFLSQVQRMKEQSPEKYEHILNGGWLDKVEGVIFNNWQVAEYQTNENEIYGQDYGFSIDPTTLIKVSVFKSKREIYIDECYCEAGLSTDEIYQLNTQHAGDSLIIGDSAEPRLIDELKNKGLNIEKAEKGQGSITAGISLLKDYTIHVTENSKNVIHELNNYRWNDKKRSTPVDENNHCIDAIRYAVTRYVKPAEEVFVF